MSSCYSSILTVMVCAASLWQPDQSLAQIVRRFPGGGVQVNAPLVRVFVGPGGATSVRAPFTAVDSPGRVMVGRRRGRLAQPLYAQPRPYPSYGGQRRPVAAQPTTPQPTPVDVDSLAYPTSGELAKMDDAMLIETLRKMMGRLNYRLSRLTTGEGWQKYLVLQRDVLGPPGASPEAAELSAIREMLPRYASVQSDSQFAKISSLPSFVASYAALREAEVRLAKYRSRGPIMTDPRESDPSPLEPAEEVLPTPEPAELPNAKRGERSILRRK